MPSDFNRALNVTEYLRRAVTSTAKTSSRYDLRLQRFRDYCTAFRTAYQELEAQAAREFGDAGKGSDAKVADKESLWRKWAEKRRNSFDINQKAYLTGIGSAGTQAPTNAVVNAEIEALVMENVSTNAEKRAIWFGRGAVNVPANRSISGSFRT